MFLRRFMHRSRKDKDFAVEIESHLAHAADELEAQGYSSDEARRRARLRFGNPRTVREREWRYRSSGWCADAWRDLRFALRSLRRTPGFTLVALFVIILGIGVNTAVFSVVDAVVLKPLSYPNSEQLVQLVMTTPEGNFPVASIQEFAIWQKLSGIFQQVAAYDEGGSGMNLTGGDHPEQVQAMHVTRSYFSLLDAPIALGRTFTAAEDRPHGGHVVVLSYGFWQQRFGGDPNIVGRNIQINGQPWLVVGVTGRKFVTDSSADLWIPFQLELNSQEMVHTFDVMARLQPGVSIAQADAQLRLATAEYRRRYGKDSLPSSSEFGAISLKQAMIGNTGTSLFILLGAVGCVLLIACSNLANLLLAKASVRRRELATRSALGAGRMHIIRQLLIESLVLSLSGGLLGLLAGVVGVQLLLHASPGDIPRISQGGSTISIDLNVLLFTLAVSILTGILFGLIPAIAASRSDLSATLNESSSRSGAGFRQGRIRSLLVISEMALALVLILGATLLIRTFLALEAVNPGFETRNVITMAMAISGKQFQTTAPVAQLIQNGREQLKALPGVVDVGVSNCLPLRGGFGMVFNIIGRSNGASPATGGAGFYSISPGYFSSFRIPILRGRRFTEEDNASAPGVVIINEAMARQYWPKGDPLKHSIQIGVGAGPAFAEPPRRVIGIVGNTRNDRIDRKAQPMMYIPLAQMPNGETALNSKIAPLWWIVHTRESPYAVLGSIRKTLRQASGGLAVAHIRTMDQVEASNIARQRFNMLLLVIFGLSALLMAAIGVYGVMSYSVQQRTQEIGIRMALGAQASNLRLMVLRQGMTLAGLGAVVGIAGAFVLVRFLASFLFGVKAWDPLSFLLAPLVLCFIALLAVWAPANRATRIDPMKALRLE